MAKKKEERNDFSQMTDRDVRAAVRNDLLSAIAFLDMIRNDAELYKRIEDVIVIRMTEAREQYVRDREPKLEGIE